MTLIEKARELRALIEKAMTETASLTEAEAVAATGLYNEVMALPTEERE